MSTGGFGTSGQVAEGIAVEGTQDALARELANLYGNAYSTGLQAQTAAMGMAPGLFGAQAGLFGQAGGLQRAEDQRAIDEAMYRHEYGQMEPYTRAQMGAGILNPLGTGFGTTMASGTTTTSPGLIPGISSLAAPFAMGAPYMFGGGMSPAPYGSPSYYGMDPYAGAYNPYYPYGY